MLVSQLLDGALLLLLPLFVGDAAMLSDSNCWSAAEVGSNTVFPFFI
jgi:hypothetical protein